jgi:hypothetical protein
MTNRPPGWFTGFSGWINVENEAISEKQDEILLRDRGSELNP